MGVNQGSDSCRGKGRRPPLTPSGPGPTRRAMKSVGALLSGTVGGLTLALSIGCTKKVNTGNTACVFRKHIFTRQQKSNKLCKYLTNPPLSLEAGEVKDLSGLGMFKPAKYDHGTHTVEGREINKCPSLQPSSSSRWNILVGSVWRREQGLWNQAELGWNPV